MKDYIRKRTVRIALHIIETSDTVRKTATRFGISKSIVHKDLTEKLPKIDKKLSIAVNNVLLQHKLERHFRGGEATRQKYKKLSAQKEVIT